MSWPSADYASLAPSLLPALWSARRRVGDASRLDELAPLAGVVSVFGLQQMPQPSAVLANWTRALAPGELLRGSRGWGRELALWCMLGWHSLTKPAGRAMAAIRA